MRTEIRRPRSDHNLAAGVEGDAAILDRDPGLSLGRGDPAFPPRNLDALDPHRRRGERLVDHVDPLQQVPELVLAEHLLQPRPVGRGEHELRRIAVEGQVAPHRGEHLRVERLLGVLLERPASRGRELGDVLEDVLDGAVLRDQLACRLVADAGDAGNVVRGVALQPDEVGHLVGPDAVPGLDTLGRVDVHVRDPARGHHQADVLRDELEGIPVGRDDGRLDAGLVRTVGERRDHVVGLPALELEVPIPEGLDDGPEVRELLPQEVRHRPAVDLVVRRELGPVYRACVPRNRHALRLVIGKELEEHVCESEQGVGREPFGRRQLLGQREKSPVREVVPVHQEEIGVASGRIVDLKLGTGQRLWHETSLRGGTPAALRSQEGYLATIQRHADDLARVDPGLAAPLRVNPAAGLS